MERQPMEDLSGMEEMMARYTPEELKEMEEKNVYIVKGDREKGVAALAWEKMVQTVKPVPDKDILVSEGNTNVWIPYDEWKRAQEYLEKVKEEWWKHHWYGADMPGTTPEQKEINEVKLAIVDDNRMIGVHRDTMKGYKLNDRYPSVVVPLVPEEYTTFIRWATSFDV